MKAKILFVMHELNLGGAERVVTNLINNFNLELYEVHFCLFKKKGALVNEIREEIIIHDLKAKRVLNGTFAYYKLILDLKPEIVFTSISHVNLLTSILIPFLSLKIKTCFITREVNNPSIRSSYKYTSRVMDFFYKFSISNYNFIIAQSNYMKQDIIKYYGVREDKITVVPNPLDIKSINYKLNLDKEKYFFDKSRKNILAVGGLRKQKGFEKLFKVFNLLDDSYQLSIVGEGPERKFLEMKIKDFNLENKVKLLGKKQNPYVYMRDCDMLMVSSNYEGFPNVVIEANVCGKFVLANDCPGIDSEIINNELNGIILNFDKPKLIVEYLNTNFYKIKEKTIPLESVVIYEAKKVSEKYHKLIRNYYNK